MKHDWPKHKLGDVLTFIGGGTPSKDIPAYYEGNIPWASVRDMTQFQLSSTEFSITEEAVNASATNIIPKGSIVISTHVGLGKICVLMQDTAINQDLKGIKFNDDSINKFFFSYWYNSIANHIIDNGRGATVKGVTLNFMKELSMPIPSLDIQTSVVGELDKINEAIAAKQEQLKQLDELSRSVFHAMFGDTYSNPICWPVVSLGSVSEQITNGSGAKIELDTYKTEGIPFFRCQNVWRNRLDLSDIVYIDEDMNEKMSSSKLKHNDLLVTKIGRLFTENSSLGRVALYDGEDDKANLSGNLSFIRLKKSVNPKFILFILISDYFRDYVRETTSGGIDKRALNNSQMKALKIYLPPLVLQNEFEKKLASIEAQKSSLNKTLAELQTLLASRMDYWFND